MARVSNTAAGGEDDVVVARIVKTRGIKGELACDIETDFPERFGELGAVTIQMPDGKKIPAVIEDNWFHKDRVVLKFEGYDSINASSALVGGLVLAPESPDEAMDEGEYHENRIIGAGVETLGGVRVGSVIRVLHTGGTDLLVVQSESGRELLVPFADAICPEVDTERGLIRIDPPEGLLEL